MVLSIFACLFLKVNYYKRNEKSVEAKFFFLCGCVGSQRLQQKGTLCHHRLAVQ
jgi:hypothetical protein